MIYSTAKELLSEIKRIMDLNDIPMKDLASRLDVTQQTVSAIFKKANPTYSTIIRICDALDLSIDINFVDNKFVTKNDDAK